jgi:hypothetical protein
MRITLDKIASSTRNADLPREVTLSEEVISQEGAVLAVRVLTEKSVYNTVELLSGRMSRLCRGDVVAGVLGSRNALRGYCGVVPERLAPGDTVQILNLAAVLGRCTSDNPELGPPINAQVLGSVLHFPSLQHRIGRPATIRQGPVRPADTLAESAPLVIVSGTCMSAGKTRAACEIVKQLAHAGRKVAAAKLSGISLRRDTLEMADFGAGAVLDFTDAGIVSTTPETVVGSAKGIVRSLTEGRPDCIVLELGDGIMGEYGVMNLLLDAELMGFVRAHVLAANDPVGAWGAVRFLQGRCPPIDAVCGPATDNLVGQRFITGQLGVPAANAIQDPVRLGEIVLGKLAGGAA